jgi:hypothetical protein
MQGKTRFFVSRTRFTLVLPSQSHVYFNFDESRRFFSMTAAAEPRFCLKDVGLLLKVITEALDSSSSEHTRIECLVFQECTSCVRARASLKQLCPLVEVNRREVQRGSVDLLLHLCRQAYIDPTCPAIPEAFRNLASQELAPRHLMVPAPQAPRDGLSTYDSLLPPTVNRQRSVDQHTYDDFVPVLDRHTTAKELGVPLAVIEEAEQAAAEIQGIVIVLT